MPASSWTSQRYHPDAAVRAAAQARGDLLIPIVKGWSTETANEIAAIGVQVHGGMGFIEETGAAQYVRDVRITTIYEGTTGIQANDLHRPQDRPRPRRRDGRADRATCAASSRRWSPAARYRGRPGMRPCRAVGLLEAASRSLVGNVAAAPERALAVSRALPQALRPGDRRLAARQVGRNCRRGPRRRRERTSISRRSARRTSTPSRYCRRRSDWRGSSRRERPACWRRSRSGSGYRGFTKPMSEGKQDLGNPGGRHRLSAGVVVLRRAPSAGCSSCCARIETGISPRAWWNLAKSRWRPRGVRCARRRSSQDLEFNWGEVFQETGPYGKRQDRPVLRRGDAYREDHFAGQPRAGQAGA